MAKYGKWIGGGLGWVLGGPIGAIFGFAAGAFIDEVKSFQVVSGVTHTGDFKVSLLVLMAAVMKADGRLMRSELEYIKKFLIAQFGAIEAEQKLKIFKEMLKQDIPLQAVCLQIKANMDYASRLQLMHFLFGIAGADGNFDPRESEILFHIATYSGISRKDHDSIKAMFVDEIESAYKVLEIDQNASDDEIKKSYRKMATKYHPDKVSHLDNSIQNAAKEKFQQLNAAYEKIKKQRGIK